MVNVPAARKYGGQHQAGPPLLRFTDAEIDAAKDTDLPELLSSLGYDVKRVGCCYTTKEIDSLRIKEMLDRFDRELEAAIVKDKTGNGFIYEMFLYELRNHEYGYTMDLDETLDALGYTSAAVQSDPRLSHGLEKARKKVLNGRR